MFHLFKSKAKPRTMLDDVQEVGGRLIIKGFRRIGKEWNCPPTEKTSDRKILEIYAQVGSAFKNVAEQRGECLSALQQNFIVLGYLITLEFDGEQQMRERLKHEINQYTLLGLKPEYKTELKLVDEFSSDADVKRLRELHGSAIDQLGGKNPQTASARVADNHNPASEINQEALSQAKNIIERDYGSLSDLPEEMRNTIANIYYSFCCNGLELKQNFPYPKMIRQGADLADGMKRFLEQEAFYADAIESMPKLIDGFRKATTKDATYYFLVDIFLFLYKYRMPDVANKTIEQLRAERRSYEPMVQEIPDLWKWF